MNRIFAAAVGAFVATIIALQFGGGYITTTLSLIAGGTVAWIGYDTRGFVRGFTRAFQETFLDLSIWKQFYLQMRYRGACALWIGVLLVSWLTSIFGVAVWNHVLLVPDAVMILSCTFFGSWLFYWGVTFMVGLDTSPRRAMRMYLEMRRVVVWELNPIPVIFSACRGLVTLYKKAPEIRAKTWKFLVLAFAYTHCEERKICFIDAVIGGAIGIYFRQPLIGAGVGALIGLVHAPLTVPIARRLATSQK